MKTKLCVIGSGFTGILTAVSLKINCPNLEVVMIDSPEPKNFGFGESGPPSLPNMLKRALKIDDMAEWMSDWILGSNSTIKYNFVWKNFLGKEDDGWVSGVGDLPSANIVLDPSHHGWVLRRELARPDNTEYTLADIWYELYLQGRRDMKDVQGDLNPHYWYCKDHTMMAADYKLVNWGPTVHINSFESCEHLRRRYGHLIDQIIPGTVQHIEVDPGGKITQVTLDNEQVIDADFFIDATGFRRVIAKRLDLPFSHTGHTVLHNSVMVVGNGYTEDIDKEMHPYTMGYGMENGWTFSIPLLNRRSFGYVYDSNFITPEQALAELEEYSPESTRVFDPLNLTWEPGGYKNAMGGNYALVGLSAGFVDPFDANTIALQFQQIFRLIEYFNGDLQRKILIRKDFNAMTWALFNAVAERTELHQCLAPRNTSEYWRRNKEVASKEHMTDKLFEIMSRYEHTPHAEDNNKFVPYFHHLYLTESIYYGLDMSRRCRKSSPELLQLAEEYFNSFNHLNQLRSKASPSIREWYTKHGVDIDQYIRFRK